MTTADWPLILLASVLVAMVLAFVLWRRTRPRNLAVVEPARLVRSGRLTPRTLAIVAKHHGVRTIVDLGSTPPGSAEEARLIAAARQLGLQRVSIRGLYGTGAGNPNAYLHALRAIRDAHAEGSPVLVQCAAGADRTGACVAFYKHVVRGASLDEALAESARFGHDPASNPVMHAFVREHAPAIVAAYAQGGDVPNHPPADARTNPDTAHHWRDPIVRPLDARTAAASAAPTPPSASAAKWTAWLTRTRRWHWLMVLAACAVVYWPNLGAPGLRSTEGHRAIPGWEALETGRWAPTTMFEALYVRKPPGMPWAIAASTTIFGETEFAARFPSALASTLMALAACFAASAWFGAPWGLAAGLAQALIPRLWSSGRTADIEALHCLSAQVAAYILVHALVVARDASARARIAMSASLGVAIIALLLTKAHAGLPVLVGVVIAACVVMRSARGVFSPVLWGGVVLAAGSLAPLAIEYLRVMRSGGAVSEDFGKFMWDASRLGKWAIFPLAVLASGLPATLALLFPWGPDAAREGDAPGERTPFAVARTLALGTLIATGVYMLAGVSNDRYAMPVLGLLGPLASYVARGCATNFTPARRGFGRLFVLGGPAVLVPGLLIGAVVNFALLEPRDARSTARPEGPALAAALPDGAEVWADGFVGAKPELLWYARRDAALAGKRVRPLWKHQEIAAAVLPPANVYMVLNTKELERYTSAGAGDLLETVAQGRADTTVWLLVRVKAPSGDQSDLDQGIR